MCEDRPKPKKDSLAAGRAAKQNGILHDADLSARQCGDLLLRCCDGMEAQGGGVKMLLKHSVEARCLEVQ